MFCLQNASVVDSLLPKPLPVAPGSAGRGLYTETLGRRKCFISKVVLSRLPNFETNSPLPFSLITQQHCWGSDASRC